MTKDIVRERGQVMEAYRIEFMGLDLDEWAAMNSVSIETARAWESGKLPVPDAVYNTCRDNWRAMRAAGLV